MPYIKPEQRDRLKGLLPTWPPADAGELNYCITLLCSYYLDYSEGRYQQINDILGALEGAKLEFYRRVAAPYEDKKIAENGDVY